MQAYRPDRVVRVLSAAVSVAYFAVWAIAVVVLLALPLLRLLAVGHPDWMWELEIPASLRDLQTTVLTRWGAGRLEAERVRVMLELPIETTPWGLVAVLWSGAVLVFALTLLALHHLRRIFQRVRDGAPFDAQNALRMRWLGFLLLALALLDAVAEFLTAAVMRRGITSENVTVAAGFSVNLPLVFVGLAVVALAEIFRRGAELEDEQALVV